MTEMTKYTHYGGGLQLPLGLDAIETIRRSGKADRTIEAYTTEIGQYLDAGHMLTDPEALRTYGATLSPGRARTFRSAIALWATETASDLDNQVTPGNWITIQATKARLGSLADGIQTQTSKGEKSHTWLSREQVRDLGTALGGDDILTIRDRVVVGLMASCGLRRLEVAALQWENIKRQPDGTGDVVDMLNVLGKGDKWRPIPIPHSLKRDLDTWAVWAGRDGLIVRRLGRSLDVWESGISGVSVHKIVKKYGALAGIDDLAAHDLRRTAAQTWYAASNHDIVLVSRLLGHASVETTQRYLELDTTNAVDAVNATAWGTERE